MPSYGLNPNGLLDTSSELDGITRSIENSIDDMDQVVQAYIAVNDGRTQEAFVTARDNWRLGITQMNKSLADAKVRLDGIHDTYRLGDARGAALFQGHV